MIFDPLPFWLGLVAMALAVRSLVFVASGTAILRDGDAKSPFSLARRQMAFWLCLVTGSFQYIWLMTGQVENILTTESPVLLGISGSLYLGFKAQEK